MTRARKPPPIAIPLSHPPAPRLAWIISILICLLPTQSGIADAPPADARIHLEHQFHTTVHPFIQTYCLDCHSKDKSKGKLDLSLYSQTDAVSRDYRRWDAVLSRLIAGEMPPEEARSQPPPSLRTNIIRWIQAFRIHEAERLAGDPGPVPARRLSNAEYDHTIRDLTGVDIQPTREFPVDPANEAGFDNSGESLAMSPILLGKYVEAARRVAEHLVFKPDGLAFAAHPMVSETDRDKYCVGRIMDFYQRQPTRYADYFMAAWRLRSEGGIPVPPATLGALAASQRLSARYLATILSELNAEGAIGPVAVLQQLWKSLPAAESAAPDARRICDRMEEFVVQARRRLTPQIQNLSVRGISSGSQPFVLWKDRELASLHQRYSPPNPGSPNNSLDLDDDVARSLKPPADEAGRIRHVAAIQRFCRLFPDTFQVTERGRVFLKEDKESTGRLLSAGFHLMVGYFRDDEPLYNLILDPAKQLELDTLWREFDFITLAPLRQYRDFIFFERAEPPRFMQDAEFDFARSEDKDATSEPKIHRLAQAYMAKATRNGGDGPAIDAIQHYFSNINHQIRWVESNRLAAEPRHLESLLKLARRAYRRPLSAGEREALPAFYHRLRHKEALDHEAAVRDTLASILVSPHFTYRFNTPKGDGIQPLSDLELASRLSYFLWASMPDDTLIALAEAGELRKPPVLSAQVRRMLRDPRVRGLATEFGGNWLDFRRFEEHNSVDRARFPRFDNSLRAAMFEEPVMFLIDLFQEDRSVLSLLDARHTFVNPALAAHYGMPHPGGGSNHWVRISNAHAYERGGLLPMSVFLTANSPGLRTSPVKRGYWVVRRLLGETIPPPPPNVPDLPSDEAKLGPMTLRESLAKHRDQKQCAGCHARFDSFGLVFEGFGPIGERRSHDLSGHPVDTRATFPDGLDRAGLDGLQSYILTRRHHDFLENFCRKLLAYALNRSLQLSDETAIRDMLAHLADHEYRIGSLIEWIATSRLFLDQRPPAKAHSSEH